MTATTIQPTTEQMFKNFALQLKNANPKAFDALVDTLDIYTSEVLLQMAQAPQEAILNMQGRSAQCLALLRLLRECHLTKAQTPPTETPRQ